MKLNPRESAKLRLHQAGFLAQKRLARGCRLNQVESVALVATQVLELARDGKSVSELMNFGRQMLGVRQVMPGVHKIIGMVQVEATFPDGTKLVSVESPICNQDGDLELALQGSFLPVPKLEIFGDLATDVEPGPAPGEIVTMPGTLTLNEGRPITVLSVVNNGDRPIQVGSHYNFAEANKLLVFDRSLAVGKRLNVAAGTAIRFEPGESKTVMLVPIAGNQIVFGGNALTDGPSTSTDAVKTTMARVTAQGFGHKLDQDTSDPPSKRARTDGEVEVDGPEPLKISRTKYAQLYGPTTGDRVRLGDTNLYIKVEKDFTSYGDECLFGGGKVLRDGMGQCAGPNAVGDSVLEVVITNALILDSTGIYKADVGLRGGKIVGIGKAGNPDTMKGVTPGMVVGPHTEAIAGERQILTAGAFDAHVHFICPQLAEEAIASGITTLLGGGTGPATGTNATTCTPAPCHLETMLKATDDMPLNFGFTGKGNSSKPEGLREVIEAGAVGLKLHEDWGTTPAVIDSALTLAEELDVQITIHTDTLNESACCEDSIAAFKGRTIHTYHSEGAGGGHAPDIIRVCGEPNVIPSSTNPTRPFTRNTIDEHLDMLVVCHHLSKNIKEDVAFAESRIRGETIAAEDILHDMGAISVISSDSQAMGRIGEVICRTWQTAHKMKQQGFTVTDEPFPDADNMRARRYIAKYTINPAIAHGMSHLIGSIEVGKLADLVLWKPAFFGIKPEIVIKGGTIAYAQMGDANASVPTCEPIEMQPMFGAKGKAVGGTSVAFVSQLAVSSGKAATYGLSKMIEPVKNCRTVGKKDMVLNNALPKITVDPETYKVTADGVELKCGPVDSVPLSQLYSLF